MKAGFLLSATTRSNEKATSSGRTGLPEWKVAPSRSVKVIVRASASISQSEASPPTSSVVSSASYCTSRS